VEDAKNAAASPWPARSPLHIELASGKVLDTAARALVMGVVNVTPDSFSDGGQFLQADAAARHGQEMAAAGADVIDVGGESTRPGSDAVSAREERRRVLPVIEELAAETAVPISIDTQKAEVAAAALDAGAEMVNDVSALRGDPEMAALVAERATPICLMHMQGAPRTMQQNPTYDEVVGDVLRWLEGRVQVALDAGIGREKIIVDPGFGFGKTPQHNLELLRRLHELHALGLPVLVGASRKSTLGLILNAPAQQRLFGSLATVACAVMAGCHAVRVHDVGPSLDVVRVCEAVRLGMRWAP